MWRYFSSIECSSSLRRPSQSDLSDAGDGRVRPRQGPGRRALPLPAARERLARVLKADLNYLVSYTLLGSDPIDENDLSHFAFANGTYHSWPFVRQTLGTFIVKEHARYLLQLNPLLDAGQVTPILDRTYPLTETADAVRYLESARNTGRIALTI